MILGLALTAIALIAGCASTSIEFYGPDGTPIGRYQSSRDSLIEGLEIQIVDGDKSTTIKLGSASGQASPVITAESVLIRSVAEAAFALGKKASP